VTAQITEFKREGDSDIHLILFGAGTGIAEIASRSMCAEEGSRT